MTDDGGMNKDTFQQPQFPPTILPCSFSTHGLKEDADH
jgi:hypothetical protein